MAIIVPCDGCRKEIEGQAALMFGVPVNGKTYKYHLCESCFSLVLAFVWSLGPPPPPHNFRFSVKDRCHANKDGDCEWEGCPQLRDGEPKRSGRHCPLDKETMEIRLTEV